MPRDGRSLPGDVLDDPTVPHGYRRVVVAVTSGRMPTPIDLTAPKSGSSAERCALHGGSAHHDTKTPARGAGKRGHL